LLKFLCILIICIAVWPMLSKMDLFDSLSFETVTVEPITTSKLLLTPNPISSPKSVSTPVSYSEKSKTYICDGRKHCSQMTSYGEAVYFNKHCPDTRMDGDLDGIPCEKQFNRR
jgi:hypothetical protein